jgi:hypothetical protein
MARRRGVAQSRERICRTRPYARPVSKLRVHGAQRGAQLRGVDEPEIMKLGVRGDAFHSVASN